MMRVYPPGRPAYRCAKTVISLLANPASWSTAIRRRRFARPPCLPVVISLSTIGRKSLALGRVVVICSCFISAVARFSNIALRWADVRLKLRPRRRWRIESSIGLVEALGQFLDVLRRPVGDLHPEMEPHLGQHLFDLVERLAAEIR